VHVEVHRRVQAKRPEIDPADVQAAFVATLRKVARLDTDPVQWIGVGLDGHGRLLEYVAIETGPDQWLVFHAMAATTKVLVETGLRR
jgi:sarcosine oxidase gamma subunit